MAPIAARKACQIARNAAGVIAVELIAAAQGADRHAPLKTSAKLQRVHAKVRELSPHFGTDRWADEMAALQAAVLAGEFGTFKAPDYSGSGWSNRLQYCVLQITPGGAAGHLQLLGTDQLQLGDDAHVVVGDEQFALPAARFSFLERRQELGPDQLLRGLARILFAFFSLAQATVPHKLLPHGAISIMLFPAWASHRPSMSAAASGSETREQGRRCNQAHADL